MSNKNNDKLVDNVLDFNPDELKHGSAKSWEEFIDQTNARLGDPWCQSDVKMIKNFFTKEKV